MASITVRQQTRYDLWLALDADASSGWGAGAGGVSRAAFGPPIAHPIRPLAVAATRPLVQSTFGANSFLNSGGGLACGCRKRGEAWVPTQRFEIGFLFQAQPCFGGECVLHCVPQVGKGLISLALKSQNASQVVSRVGRVRMPRPESAAPALECLPERRFRFGVALFSLQEHAQTL